MRLAAPPALLALPERSQARDALAKGVETRKQRGDRELVFINNEWFKLGSLNCINLLKSCWRSRKMFEKMTPAQCASKRPDGRHGSSLACFPARAFVSVPPLMSPADATPDRPRRRGPRLQES